RARRGCRGVTAPSGRLALLAPQLLVRDDVHRGLLGGGGTAVDADVARRGAVAVAAGRQLVGAQQPPGAGVADLVVHGLTPHARLVADAVAFRWPHVRRLLAEPLVEGLPDALLGRGDAVVGGAQGLLGR